MSLGFGERKQKHMALDEEEYMNVHACLCIHLSTYTAGREGQGVVCGYTNKYAFCLRTKRTFRGSALERARVTVRRRERAREDWWWQRRGEHVLCGCVVYDSFPTKNEGNF